MKQNDLRCPKCGSENVKSRGDYIKCGSPTCPEPWTAKNKLKSELETVVENNSFKFQSDGTIGIVTAKTTEPVFTLEDAIRVCEIDLKVWHVDRWEITNHTPWRKAKKSSWHVKQGTVIQGDVEDTGKILMLRAVNIKLYLTRRTEEIRKQTAVEDLIKEIRKNKMRFPSPKISRKKGTRYLYEVDLFDVHFGKQTWAEETGAEYNIEIAKEYVLNATRKLLSHAEKFPIERILLPFGNDYFNADNIHNTTTAGTVQHEDKQWNQTFREGRRLAQDIIAMCLQVAPVEVLVVPGNHDKTRTFMLGECLDAFFNNSKHVTIDNSPKSRKYYFYGSVLLGFAHGKDERKINLLPSVMDHDNRHDPRMLNVHTKEWHLGHVHHQKEFVLMFDEKLGCTVRTLSSLSTLGRWEFDNLFVGSKRAATSFVWCQNEGFKGQFLENGENSKLEILKKKK